jgi:hypothetical protein
MRTRQPLIWALAFFTASVLSYAVGVVGYALNGSPFPPEGGGIFKLIVLPISVVWIVILGTVYSRFAQEMKRITIHQALSVIIALLSLTEWICLGLATPIVRVIDADFRANLGDFDWPYPYIMSLDWVWCIPVGILLATGLIIKDQFCSRRVAGILNLTVFLAGIALAVAWLWGTVPHRISQTVVALAL